MHMNRLESDGYNALLGLVRESDDASDPWGSNIEWMFALCDYHYLINGKTLPGYRPAAGLSLEDERDYALEMLFETNADWNDDDLVRVFTILSRRDDWLRLADMNY